MAELRKNEERQGKKKDQEIGGREDRNWVKYVLTLNRMECSEANQRGLDVCWPRNSNASERAADKPRYFSREVEVDWMRG
jgi:protein involved in sex pheromone biosynthesis